MAAGSEKSGRANARPGAAAVSCAAVRRRGSLETGVALDDAVAAGACLAEAGGVLDA
jgi:hypothetical protein